jgi:hypothetical protein
MMNKKSNLVAEKNVNVENDVTDILNYNWNLFWVYIPIYKRHNDS